MATHRKTGRGQAERFPPDSMFQPTEQALGILRPQIVTSSSRSSGDRKRLRHHQPVDRDHRGEGDRAEREPPAEHAVKARL